MCTAMAGLNGNVNGHVVHHGRQETLGETLLMTRVQWDMHTDTGTSIKHPK